MGMNSSKYLKWKKISRAQRNWEDGNKYFRAALIDVEDINKLTTGESGLTANKVINKQYMEQKVRDEMAEKVGEYFDNLAMAATTKSENIDAMDQSISNITSSNDEVAATTKRMTS